MTFVRRKSRARSRGKCHESTLTLVRSLHTQRPSHKDELLQVQTLNPKEKTVTEIGAINPWRFYFLSSSSHKRKRTHRKIVSCVIFTRTLIISWQLLIINRYPVKVKTKLIRSHSLFILYPVFKAHFSVLCRPRNQSVVMSVTDSDVWQCKNHLSTCPPSIPPVYFHTC